MYPCLADFSFRNGNNWHGRVPPRDPYAIARATARRLSLIRRHVASKRSESRHIERQLTEDSCIAIRGHRDKPDVHQLASKFPTGMHSKELQIRAPKNQLEKTLFLADDATARIVPRPTT